MWKINCLSQQSIVNIGVIYTLSVVVVLSCVFALAATKNINYCGAKMCGGTNAHTFCRYREGPSNKCVGYEEAKLTSAEKTRVLSRLNSHRNVAAGGGVRGLPPAGDMLKLRWVEQLANEAQRWADQCRPPRIVEEHDACRDLYSLKVGQCVASVVGKEPVERVEKMVDAWYIQSILYKGNVTYYVPPRKGEKYYGDFAQTMWAKSYMVGCARSRFKTPRHGRLLNVERLVCNIAPYGPEPTMPLWLPEAPTDVCPSRSTQSTVWRSLCDYQQKQTGIIALDPSMSLKEHLILNSVLEIEANETLNYVGSLDEVYIAQAAKAVMENMYTTQAYLFSVPKSEILDLVDVITMEFVPEAITENPRFRKNTSMNTINKTVKLKTKKARKLTKAKRRKHRRNKIKRPGIHMAFVPQAITENSSFNKNISMNIINRTMKLKTKKARKLTKAKRRKHRRNKIKRQGIHKKKLIQKTKNNKAIKKRHKKGHKKRHKKKKKHAGNVLTGTSKDKTLNLLLNTDVSNSTEYYSDKFQNMNFCHNRTNGSCVDEGHNFTSVSEVTEDFNFTVAPKQLLEDVTDERHLTSRRHFGVFDIHMYGLMDQHSFSGSGDDADYIVVHDENTTTTTTTTEDPESARELQEALERIENDLEPSDAHGKARRDLGLKELEATSREYAETPSNDTDSKDQVLNILKLIPSWTAPTETPNVASRVTPPLVIVLALRL